MKLNYKYQLAILIAVLAFAACSKDKENYDYSIVNRVEVKLVDSIFKLQQLDELNVTPVLTETAATGTTAYAYAWHVYPKQSNFSSTDVGAKDPEALLISEEKDLKTIINLSPNDYYLQYTITNLKTGIKTLKRYSLTVNGAFYEGWLVMNNVDGQGKLSFIRKDDEVFMDPLMQIHGMRMEGKALKAYSGVISKMSTINAFTDKEVYLFNADDFKLQKNSGELFLERPTLQVPFYTVNHINTDQYIIDAGKVYGTIAPNFGAPGKYSVPFAGLDYEAFPFLFSGNKFYISVYDNKHKRFIHTSYNSRAFSAYGGIVDANYDLRNVGKTMIAADRGLQGEYYTLMKDDTDYYYYAYNPNLASPAVLAQPIKQSPAIHKATAFAASSSLQHLYYAAGNEIYLYDILANTSRLLYSFPTATNIKDIQMYKGKGWGSFNDPLFNKRIVVAAVNAGAGSVYYFDLLPTGDIANNTYFKAFTGFGDIVHLNYRNPNQ